jgi:hypothetical protein
MKPLCALLLVLTCLPVESWATSREEAKALLENDRWEEVLAMATDYTDPVGRTILGQALFRAGRLEESGQVLEAVVEGSSDPPARALAQLGLLRYAEGRGSEGTALLLRAGEIAPDDPWVLYRAAGAQPSHEEAIAVMNRYLDLIGETDPDRAEAVRGTIRFYRSLGDRQLWVSAERPETVEIDLKRLPGGLSGTRAWVMKAQVGDRDKPVSLLLDSGSSGLYLDERIARKAGMERLSQETVFGGGGSGRHQSEKGIFSRFELGPLRYREALGATSTSRLDPGGRFRGLVGMQVFAGYVVTLDLRNGSVFLEPPGGEEPGTGWSAGAPYWMISGQMLVRVQDARGATGLFLLDTGATRTLLSRSFTAQVEGAVEREGGTTRGFGGVRPGSTTASGVRLEFQGMTSADASLSVADLSMRSRMAGVEISGFLGLDMLNGHRIRIDTARRKIYVQNGDGRNE